MSEEQRGKSSASRWMIWSAVAVVIYVLSVGPMTVVGLHLDLGTGYWSTVRVIYQPLHFPSKYPPFSRFMSQYTCWWAAVTDAPGLYVPVIYSDPDFERL